MNESNWNATNETITESMHRNWGWFLALGIVLAVLGVIAIGTAVLTTIVSVAVFGWLLVIGGIVTLVECSSIQQRRGFWLNLISGLVYMGLGALLIINPVVGALSLTVMIAAFFVVGGILRIIHALARHTAHRGWVLLNGLITLALGCMIWAHWPVSGLWVIGTFIGIDMIMYGWTLIMLGIMAHHVPPALTA